MNYFACGCSGWGLIWLLYKYIWKKLFDIYSEQRQCPVCGIHDKDLACWLFLFSLPSSSYEVLCPTEQYKGFLTHLFEGFVPSFYFWTIVLLLLMSNTVSIEDSCRKQNFNYLMFDVNMKNLSFLFAFLSCNIQSLCISFLLKHFHNFPTSPWRDLFQA